jgi:NTE family protein
MVCYDPTLNKNAFRNRQQAGKLGAQSSQQSQKQSAKAQHEVMIGLAISSGGARGLAHLGVIEILEKNNIPIAAVAGSSMGAYVGALWCAGYNAQQLIKLAEEIHSPRQFRKLSDLALPPSKGIFWGLKARNHLRKSIGDIHFNELKRSLIVIAADLDTHRRVIGHQGRVIDAVHASCALPGLIVPVHYQGHRCIDGGVIEPIPICSLRNHVDLDYVIAVSTIPSGREIEACSAIKKPPPKKSLLRRALAFGIKPFNLLAPGNIIDTFNKSLKASQIRMADDAYAYADLVIKPVSCQGNWYDYHNYQHFIEIGRQAAEKALPKIFELLQSAHKNQVNLPHDPPPKPLVGKRLSR